MRMSAAALLMIFTTIFLSGCAQESHKAALDDRGGNFYSRNGVKSLTGGLSSMASSLYSPSTINSPVFQQTNSNAATMTVSSNDLPPPTAGATQPITKTTTAPLMTSASWQWPVDGKVTEAYGKQANGQANQGIIIAAAEGTPIKAAQAGEVAFVGQDTKNYGNIAILRHTDGTMSSYAHAREITVAKGARVNAGSVIGTVGKSGNAKAPQLHFAVREGKTAIDPMVKLPHQVALR